MRVAAALRDPGGATGAWFPVGVPLAVDVLVLMNSSKFMVKFGRSDKWVQNFAIASGATLMGATLTVTAVGVWRSDNVLPSG